MKRSKFSLSHTNLLSCDMGELVPIMCKEVLPGDTWQQSTSALVRVSPLLAPVMHPVNVRIHHWFVPYRLIWSDWENFITGGSDGLNASVFPTITVNSGTGWAVGSLADYLGVPPLVDDLPVSALPFRAYAKIWNEFYRDQDLETALTIDLTDGADSTTNTTLKNVCWEKDYFTSARPWTQKGTEVSLPLGTTAPIEGIAQDTYGFTEANTTPVKILGADSDNRLYLDASLTANSDFRFSTDSSQIGLQADLASATSATINDLREAFALQRYAEARARYGSRYTEYLRYLGVNSSDARLQRPEYLGGGKQVITFSEVLQTAPDTSSGSGDAVGVGDLKGHGMAAMRSNRYRRYFEEHGVVLSLLSVIPKTIYVNGLPREFSRATKEDFYQKELEHLGQQPILNKEVYWAHATPEGTFGYQDRYDEYRRAESKVCGEFRSSTLSHWHYGRIFTSDPALNSTFVSSVPTKRVNAVTSTDCLWIMANHSIQARRLLSQTGYSSVF